jgi:hypothetical protein
MNFSEMFKRDMASIATEVGQKCILRGRNVTASFVAVVSDQQTQSGGYLLVDGKEVQATAQFDAGKYRDKICVGDTFVVESISYRVTNITKTHGDTIVTIALSLEGKR